MKKKEGKLIILGGIDGSGKKTQFDKLVERFKERKIPVATFDFPQYGKPSAYFVEQYLNGKYGLSEEVDPYLASTFYALDRLEAVPRIKKAKKEGRFCLFNRYVESSMAHQGSKILVVGAQMVFLKWLVDFEYIKIGIPKPDFTMILHLPTEIAQQRIDKKESRKYVDGKKRNGHESSAFHLSGAGKMYLNLAKWSPNEFLLIDCMKNERECSEEEIHKKIWQEIQNRFL